MKTGKRDCRPSPRHALSGAFRTLACLILTLAFAQPARAGVTRPTNNSRDDVAPQINSAGQVAWELWDGVDYEIDFWDGSSIRPLTNNSTNDSYL
jgi:hypothetical protein